MKKSGKALFEVITTYRQKHPGTGPLKPEWMRRREQPGNESMAQLTPEPMAAEEVRRMPVQEAPLAPTLQPLAGPMDEMLDESMETAGSPRLTVSMNYVTATVATVALVVLLVAAFLLGRMTASERALIKPTTAPATIGKGVTPAPPVNRVPERPKATNGLFAGDLAAGKYYFVIQVIQNTDAPEDEKKQEADKIARFCSGAPAGKALSATRALYVTKDGARRWLVIATEPFENNTKTNRVVELEKKAEALGADPANPTLYKFKLEKTLVLLNEG